MPTLVNNDAQLYYEVAGSGEPMVLIHGSWVDHHDWDLVVAPLAASYRVLRFDRRGHSQSTAPDRQGVLDDDIADLAAMIETAGAPAHVVANSFGGVIALNLAARRPELFRSLSLHEPPLLGLLIADPSSQEMAQGFMAAAQPVGELIAAGRHEEAARTFINDVALGPGAWDVIPDEQKRLVTANAPTFLDEMNDPNGLNLDLAGIASFDKAALVTNGDQSPPFFAIVIGKLKEAFPNAEYRTVPGWGHVPHVTNPQDYLEIVKAFVRP